MSCRCRNKRRCSCKGSTGAFVTETVNKVNIVPKQGEPGNKGDVAKQVYTKSTSSTIIPTIEQTPNPTGWSTQPPTLNEGEYRWMSIGYVNSTGEVLTQPWSVPVTDLSVIDVEPIAPETDDDIFF